MSLDLAVELCHPVAESITNGLLVSAGNLFGIILSLTLSLVIQILDDLGVWIALASLILVAFVSLILSFSIKEDLRRQAEEKKG